LYYEVYGSGEPTIFLLPTWSIIHSRHWKMQIPYLARHCRVITFDGRGNGRSGAHASGRLQPAVPARWRMLRKATAMMVFVGFCAPEVTNTDPSAT
jgi:pimeloyl-ACP methyl ester carboxylesterase